MGLPTVLGPAERHRIGGVTPIGWERAARSSGSARRSPAVATADAHAGSAALRELLYEDSALRWLPDGASSWCQGGCLVLALALSALVDGEMLVVASRRGPEHVVVRLGDVYLDGDGISTEEELLHRWRTEERVSDAFLDRFRLEACRARHIPCAGPAETFALARHLLERGAGDLVGVTTGPTAGG
jgi:hypothetical protein